MKLMRRNWSFFPIESNPGSGSIFCFRLQNGLGQQRRRRTDSYSAHGLTGQEQ